MKLTNLLAALVLGLFVLTFAVPADAAGNAPKNGQRYDCYNGTWKSITFNVGGLGDLRRGTCDLVYPDGSRDTKKCDIFWHNNSPNWEFTLRNEAQCKNMYIHYHHGVPFLYFAQCESVKNTFCVPR